MIVVADTGPIHYLVLSGFIETLRDLYGGVVLPEAVKDELSHPAAPAEISGLDHRASHMGFRQDTRQRNRI